MQCKHSSEERALLCGVRILLIAIVASCDHTSFSVEQRCKEVREHLVELHLRDDVNRDAHADVVRRAMGDQFVASCSRSMTKSEMTCIVDANSEGAARACTTNKDASLRSTGR